MTASIVTKTDALIVGSGWAGAVAALKLASAGRRVVVLEAREGRLGGRAFTHTWTPETGDSNARTTEAKEGGSQWAVDFGCSWIHGYNEGNPCKAIAARYGVAVHTPKPTASRIVGAQGFPSDSLASRLGSNLAKAQAAAKEQAATLSDNAPAQASASLAATMLAPSSPLYEGLSSATEKEQATALARTLHVPLGITLEQAASFGSDKAFGGTDAAPEGGFTKLISHVIDDAKRNGAQFLQGEAVSHIAKVDGKAGVRITTATGKVFEAPNAVVTIPHAVLRESLGMFEPALPKERQDIIARTTVGNLNKIMLTYDSAWWDEEVGTFSVLPTSSGEIKSDTSLSEALSRSTLIVQSLCAPTGIPGSSPSLLIMIGADGAVAIEQYSRLEVAEAAHAYLAPRLARQGTKAPAAPNHSFYTRWKKQAFTRGATTSPIAVGAGMKNDFVQLGTSLWDGALGFAGEATEPDHRGSIAGAIVSGEREADRVLSSARL